MATIWPGRGNVSLSADVERLATRVQPDKLVLFHVPDRYTASESTEQLAEVRQQFARVVFPENWDHSEPRIEGL